MKFKTSVIMTVFIISALSPTYGQNIQLDPVWEQMTQEVHSLKNQGKLGEGLRKAQETLKYSQDKYGGEHDYTIISMGNLSIIYEQIGRYQEAETLNKTVLAWAEKTFGKNSPNAFLTKNNLAYLYSSQGKYSLAEPLYIEVLEFRRKTLGNKNHDTLLSINNLAGMYYEQGRLKEAEILYLELLSSSKSTFGKNHPSTLKAISTLGSLYNRIGRFDEAEPLLIEALELSQQTLGPTHPVVLFNTGSLGNFLLFQGRYAEAEQVFLKMLKIQEEIVGKNTPGYIATLSNLATLYNYQKKNNKAGELLEAVNELSKETFGDTHNYTLSSSSNLAEHYSIIGKLSEAEKIIRSTLEQRKIKFGENHPDTLGSINSLAALLSTQGKFLEAEKLFKDALAVSTHLLGENHPDHVPLLNNLAWTYDNLEDYKNANSTYLACLDLCSKVLSIDHPFTQEVLLNQTISKIHFGYTQDALGLLKQYEGRLLSRTFRELYASSSSLDRRVYINNIKSFQDICISLAIQNDDDEIKEFVAEAIIRWKQIYIEENIVQNRLVSTSTNPKIKALTKQRADLQAIFSRQVYHEKTQDKILTTWNKLTKIENDIQQASKHFVNKLQIESFELKDILNKIKNDSAIVEFRTFHVINFKNRSVLPAPVSLSAIVISKDNEKAGNQIDIINLGLLSSVSSSKSSDDLYGILFREMDQLVKDKSRLYISPDGPLFLLSFDSLKLPDDSYLIQRQEILTLHSSRDLLAKRTKSDSNLLIGVGGVDYGAEQGEIELPEKESRVAEKVFKNNLRVAEVINGKFTKIPNSLFEVNVINEIFNDNVPEGKSIIFTDDNATESSLKNLIEAPRVIHLATHGFFNHNYSAGQWGTEAPLVLSGLALSSANHGLKGKVDDLGEDGLLFASEVSGLNFQGTELVCLSACDTGKGLIDASEGVYGLTRAFRVAGAQSILMTLWTVRDQSSKAFMMTFYEKWLENDINSSPANALRQTKLEFIEHSNINYRDPRVWAPYVLLGIY